MHDESYNNFQYDSCVSRGICSISPRISALQTVLILYLQLYAKYSAKLEISNEIKNYVLNTVAIVILNPDFNEYSFLFAVNNFKEILLNLVLEISDLEKRENEKKYILDLIEKTSDITSAIKYGEIIFNNAQKSISSEIRALYNVMLVIAKSLSINLIEYESLNKNFPRAFEMIVQLLNTIRQEKLDENILIDCIINSSKEDMQLMQLIREEQENRYGRQNISEVSFSTYPNKAVLVVGSYISELEMVLQSLKNKNIDVYTHDEMMLAHTFPKFNEYKNLKGQFGLGLENCLLDFATFPGPIVLTKHSLHNIESFYRGRLFTTDFMTSPKGVIKIENDDFSKFIEIAEKSKGFKKGKECETITIGYNFEETIANLKSKIESQLYERIFLIGLDNYSLEQKNYFEKLFKLMPKNILVVSFSYKREADNFIHINACYDGYSIVKIFDFLKSFKFPMTIFIPKCEKKTISQIIYFSQVDNVKVYIGKCTPIILNPALIQSLKKHFSIESISISKKDLEEIIKDK